MNLKSLTLAAAMLTLPAIVAAPGINGVAHAADASISGSIGGYAIPGVLDASAFGVSVGAGRGVRVGVVIGSPKVVSQRKVIVRSSRLR